MSPPAQVPRPMQGPWGKAKLGVQGCHAHVTPLARES
jgi:hypothetical protein